MLVGVFPHFFVVIVLFVAVPAVLPFSVVFHHSSVDGPSELLTFVQLFSGSPPLLDYRNFCNIQNRKKTDNKFLCGIRESRKNNSNYVFLLFFFQHVTKRGRTTKIKKI